MFWCGQRNPAAHQSSNKIYVLNLYLTMTLRFGIQVPSGKHIGTGPPKAVCWEVVCALVEPIIVDVSKTMVTRRVFFMEKQLLLI